VSDRILYSRREAAEELSISVSSIDQLIRTKKISTRRQGRRVLIARAELDKYARQDNPKIWPPKQNGKTTRKLAVMRHNNSAVA
jgi:excisionase family DNA binding protein